MSRRAEWVDGPSESTGWVSRWAEWVDGPSESMGRVSRWAEWVDGPSESMGLVMSTPDQHRKWNTVVLYMINEFNYQRKRDSRNRIRSNAGLHAEVMFWITKKFPRPFKFDCCNIMSCHMQLTMSCHALQVNPSSKCCIVRHNDVLCIAWHNSSIVRHNVDIRAQLGSLLKMSN